MHPARMHGGQLVSYLKSKLLPYSQEYNDPSITKTLIPVNISISMQEVQMN